jgi:predicted DNA-binding transcriptional regulator AlpA
MHQRRGERLALTGAPVVLVDGEPDDLAHRAESHRRLPAGKVVVPELDAARVAGLVGIAPTKQRPFPPIPFSLHARTIDDSMGCGQVPSRYPTKSGGSGVTRFLTVRGLAERWGVDPRVVYGLRYRGDGPPAIRVGRELRFALADVERWEEARRDDGTSRRAS